MFLAPSSSASLSPSHQPDHDRQHEQEGQGKAETGGAAKVDQKPPEAYKPRLQ